MFLYKISRSKLRKIDKKFINFGENINYSNNNVNLGAGFFYYKEFPISKVLKNIYKNIVKNDKIFDYEDKELIFYTKDIILKYLNLKKEYKEDLILKNIFITGGTLSGFQLLKEPLIELYGYKRRVLIITPNFMEGNNILLTELDDIYLYDIVLNGEEEIQQLLKNKKFDLILCEYPMWPQGYYLSDNFLQVLSKIGKHVIIDKSIDSYTYIDTNVNKFPNNFIVLNSISKEFGITFKGFLLLKDNFLMTKVKYYYDSFGYSSNISTPILLYIYMYKLYKKNQFYLIDYKFKNKLKDIGIYEIVKDVNNFVTLDKTLFFNKNNFLLYKRLIYIYLQKYISSGIIKIFSNQCGTNILIGIKNIGLDTFEMSNVMIKYYGIELFPLAFPIGFKYKYNLYRLNISSSNKKGFIIGIKHLSLFLNKILVINNNLLGKK